jgi:hypothetical protein
MKAADSWCEIHHWISWFFLSLSLLIFAAENLKKEDGI